MSVIIFELLRCPYTTDNKYVVPLSCLGLPPKSLTLGGDGHTFVRERGNFTVNILDPEGFSVEVTTTDGTYVGWVLPKGEAYELMIEEPSAMRGLYQYVEGKLISQNIVGHRFYPLDQLPATLVENIPETVNPKISQVATEVIQAYLRHEQGKQG
jgi:hypothetical protein